MASTLARIVITVAVLAAVVFTFTKKRLSENPRSRFATVERLVETGSWSHDGSPFRDSIDAVMIDGRRYSSKPPLYTAILAGEAWVLHEVTGLDVYPNTRLYLGSLVLLNQVLLWGVVLWVGLRWVRRQSRSPWVHAVFAASLSFGLLPFGYSVTLNNHTPTAACLFVAFVLLDAARHRGSGDAAAFGVGLLTGLAASFELTAGIFVPLFVSLLWTRGAKAFALGAVGAILPLIPTFGIYWGLSGSPMPFYMQRELYDYPGSYWNDPKGADALDDPLPLYAFHTLLGHHGLFSLSPILAFGVWGLARGIRRSSEALRSELVAVALGSAVIFGYIVTTTNNYGGNAIGMRWFAQLMPLWMAAAVPVFEHVQSERRGRIAVYLALAVSAATVIETLIQSAFTNGGWVIGLMKVAGVPWP